jgi:hypothetical protein
MALPFQSIAVSPKQAPGDAHGSAGVAKRRSFFQAWMGIVSFCRKPTKPPGPSRRLDRPRLREDRGVKHFFARTASFAVVFTFACSMSFDLAFGARRTALPASRRAAYAGVAMAALLVASHGKARAQLVNQYLDPNIPGYDNQPGVTVASRAHPEYDAPGIQLGLFKIMPSLDESVGYDDNVTGTPSPHGSVLIDTNAKIESLADFGNGTANASVTVDNQEFPEQSRQSFTDWTAAIGGSHEFGQDTLYFGATHLNEVQTPRDLDAPQLDRAIAYRVDDIRASYNISFGRLQVQPGMDVSWFSYDNGSVLGVPYIQNYRNRIVYEPNVTLGYEFATRRRLVLVVRDADAIYSTTYLGQPRPDFNDISVLAGVDYDVDGATTFRLLAGYERRSFSSQVYRTIQAPILEGSVTWTPTGLTTVTATAARYIEDSAAEATVGYTETALRLNVDHELFRNIVLNANASFYNDDYAQNGGSQQFYTGGVGATWRLNRNIRLSADYTYSSRRTQGGADINAVTPYGGVFGGSYSENVFRLRLRFGL